MADQDWRTGAYAIDPQGRGNFAQQQEFLKGQEFTIVRYFDCAANPMLAADTYKVITIDAGVTITKALVVQTVLEGNTCTLDIGDSGSATAYHDDLDMNSATGVAALTTQTKHYSAANYIVLDFANNASAAKFYIVLHGVRQY